MDHSNIAMSPIFSWSLSLPRLKDYQLERFSLPFCEFNIWKRILIYESFERTNSVTAHPTSSSKLLTHASADNPRGVDCTGNRIRTLRSRCNSSCAVLHAWAGPLLYIVTSPSAQVPERQDQLLLLLLFLSPQSLYPSRPGEAKASTRSISRVLGSVL